MSDSLNRRTFLSTAAVLGAASAGGSLLAACGAPQAGPGADRRTVPPGYLPFQGPEPDLKGNPDGALDGYFSYPADPPESVTEPPGDGAPVTGLTHLGSGSMSPEAGGNPYWRSLNERLGSDLELIRTVTADYANKFATVLAGGNPPDLMNVLTNLPRQPEMFRNAAADLTDHLSGDAVAKFPNLANLPTWAWKLCTIDGAIRSIPIHRGIVSSPVFTARQDLLDLQGITPEVTDFASFVDLCRELNRPKQNVFALISNPLEYVRGMCQLPNNWVLDDKGLTSALSFKDQQHEALAAAKQIYDEGLIVPDGLTNPQNDSLQLFYAGRGLLVWGTHSGWPGMYRINAAAKDFRLTPLGYPGFDGGDGMPARTNSIHSRVMIGKASSDRVETLLKVVNYLAAPFGSAEYLFLVYGEAGVDYELKGSDPVVNADTALNLRVGSSYLGAPPQVSYLAGLPDAVRALHQSQTKLAEIGALDPTEGLYSATAERTGSMLQTIDQTAVDFILGRKTLGDWDELIDRWLKGDGDTIRGEYETAVADADR